MAAQVGRTRPGHARPLRSPLSYFGEKVFSDWRASVELFAADCWPDLTFWEWQSRFLAQLRGRRRVCLMGPRGARKTSTAAIVAIHDLITSGPSRLVYCTAPIWRQLDEGLLVEIRTLWQRSALLRQLFPDWTARANGIDTSSPDWRLFCAATDRAESLESPHGAAGALVVIDEAAQYSDAALRSLEGVLADPRSRVLALSVAGDPSGFFHNAFRGRGGGWDLCFEIAPDEIPEIAAHGEELSKRYGRTDPIVRRHFFNEFAAAQEWRNFFDSSLLARARSHGERGLNQTEVPGLFATAPRACGWDPAYSLGGDTSAVCFLEGRHVRFETLPKGLGLLEQADLLAGRVRNFLRASKSEKIAVDSIATGKACHERLREKLEDSGIGVHAFTASAAALSEPGRFQNEKTRLCFALRRLLEADEIGLPPPNDALGDRVQAELASLSLVTSGRGLLRISDPKSSPDLADSLLVALSATPWPGFGPPSYAPSSPAWLTGDDDGERIDA
jgi:hypothetical protein